MEPSSGTRKNPFTVLKDREFRLLFSGTTFAMLAFGMMQVVQGVVAFDLTGRNGAVGFVYFGQGVAMLVLSPVGGTLSDRISKKLLLTSAQFVIGMMFGLIAILIVTGWITIMLLAGASLILGCMYSMMGPTRQAWVGDLLQGEELTSGVALQQLMMNSTRIIGPLIAGLLIGIDPIGPAGTYFSMAGLFGLVVFILMFMKAAPPRPRSATTSVRGDITDGFRYILSTPDLRVLASVFLGVVLCGFCYQTLMPGYLVNELGHPAKQLGILFGATALGGIIVTWTLATRTLLNPTGLMLWFGAAFAVSLALLGAAPNFTIALICGALVGACSSGFQMLNNVNLMQRSDPAYFGRVMSVTMMAFGLNSIVSYPVGIVADHIGERATLAGLAVASMSVVVAGVVASRLIQGLTGPGTAGATPGG